MNDGKANPKLWWLWPVILGFVGSIIGTWAALGSPDSATTYAICGGIVGASLGLLLGLFTRTTVTVNQGGLLDKPEDLDRRRAHSYQTWNWEKSLLQTAFAFLLIAVGYTVVRSLRNDSILFLFLVVLPCLIIAEGLVFRSWGVVGRMIVLVGKPIIFLVAGIYLWFSSKEDKFISFAILAALAVMESINSVKRYRKIQDLIAKYPLKNA